MSNYKIGVEFEADGSKAVNAINQVSQAMQNLQSQVGNSSNGMQKSFNNLGSSISGITKALGAYLSISAIGGVIKKSLEASASLEQASVSFEVFTGSAKTASELMQSFKDQALKSPMQFQDIVQGGKTLMNYGITAQQVIPITKMLGDISGGNADRFQRLSLAFGQVNGAGRLMGQELRQMINAGFNPLQTLSEKTGESMASLTKRMHDGKISVQEVAQAFVIATSEGGRFFGNAEKQSQTLRGAFNKMSEGITFTLSSIGDSIAKTFDLSGLAEHVTNLFNQIAKNFETSNKGLGESTFWADAIKGLMTDIALATDLTIKGFIKLGALIEKVFGGSSIKMVEDFSKWLDNIAIKFVSIFSTKGAEEFKKFLNYVENFGKQKINISAPSATDWNKQLAEFLKSFNAKPSGEEKVTKKKKPKDYTAEWASDLAYYSKLSDKINEMKKFEANALNDIDSIYEDSFDKKIKRLTDNFEEQKKLYEKYGLSFKNIQLKYIVELAELQKGKADKTATILRSAMDKSIIGLPQVFQDNLTKFASDKSKFDKAVDDLTTEDKVNKIKTFAQSTYSALNDFSINIYNGFGQIVGGIASGIMSFSDGIAQAGSMFLNLFGDLLIQMGNSAIKFGITAEAIQNALKSIGLTGAPAILAGTLAVATGYALKGMAEKTNNAISNNANAKLNSKSTTGSTKTSGMTSGSSYQYGGASYATQTVRLSIDLTGAITASPTGYNINKSLETVLRVTGR